MHTTIREFWQECRQAIETWVLIDFEKFEERVRAQEPGWALVEADQAGLHRLGLLCAWELHPLPARLDRQLSQLGETSPFLKQLKAAAQLLPHRLVEDNWELVRKAAGRYHIPSRVENETEFQELLSVGREALFIAAQKFYKKPRGTFKNFAWNFLREKMREEQGRRHPVPPKIRKKLGVLSQLREEAHLKSLVLTKGEIQSRLKVGPEELQELLQIESVWGNGMEFETEVALEDLEAPDHGIDQLSKLLEIEDAVRLSVALQFIEEPGRSLISKLYFEEKTLREVAEELDLSLPVFKKAHKKALAEMKKHLE